MPILAALPEFRPIPRILITLCFSLALLGEAPADPHADKRRLVRDVFAAMDKQDYARCRELIPGDCDIQIVGEPEPMKVDALIAFLKDYWKAFPDTVHTIRRILAEGDLVAVQVTCQGTQRGEFQGVAPTGRIIRYDGVHFLRFEQNRIKSWWVLDDNLSLMQQLGLKLAPPEAITPGEKGK